MADYVVSTVFRGENQLTNVFSEMSRESQKFGRGLGGVFDTASKNALSFKSVLTGILSADIIRKGFGLASSAIGGLKDAYLDFDQAVTSAASKLEIKRGTEEFEALALAARNVAKITPFSAAEAAKGIDYLAASGFNAAQSMATLPGVARLAIAADTDLAQASDIAANSLSSLGLMTSDTAKLTENLTRVSDVYARVAVDTSTDLTLLFESMRDVAPIATGLGASVETLGAQLGILANAGIKGGESGTALRNMYLRLTSGVAEVDKQLTKYKINISENGKLRSMIDILDELRRKTEGLDDATRQAAYTHLFGERAVASATILMRAGGETIHAFEKKLQNASGASKELSDAMGQSLPNRLKIMKSAFIEHGMKIADVFSKDISGAVDAFSEKIKNFDIAPVLNALRGAIDFTRTLITVTSELSNLIIPLTAGFAAYKLALIGLTTAQALQAVGFMWGLRNAIHAAWVATLAFNASLFANPITWIAIGIGAAVAALTLLIMNWDEFKKSWMEGIKAIGEFLYTWIVEPLKKAMEWVHYFNPLRQLTGKEDAASRGYRGKQIADEQAAAEDKLQKFLGSAPAGYADEFVDPEVGMSIDRREINFRGNINIAGAPSGTTAESTTEGAPPITMNLGDQ
jgi:TP901 family phage tail tape measure protein